MFVKKRFPLALAVCLFACTFAVSAAAQDFSRARQVSQTYTPDGASRLEDDVVLVSEAAPVLPEATRPTLPSPVTKSPILTPRLLQFNHLLMNAIEDRLGAPYVYGSSGPNVFDCSGFVWSAFQSAGVNFDRVSARNLWNEFAPASEEEKTQFGTLVFFNNLKHVGIVADSGGFYHASTSHGVQYAPFNDYWKARIVGFRRIPLPTALLAE